MFKQAVLLTILSSVFCLFTGTAAYSDADNPYDEGYPPWRHKGKIEVSWGFPSRMQVLHLRSLTPQQRQEIDAQWQPYVLKHRALRQQLSDLQNKLKTDPTSSSLQQQIKEMRLQIIKNAHDAWVAAKPKLTSKQLQGLKHMGANNTAKDQKVQSSAPTTGDKGIHKYNW